jgi:hypothetical protein
VTIDGPQICLLLHSAVAHRYDAAYWASELGDHEEATRLLETIQQGQVDGLEKPDKQKAILCARALGLGPDEVGEGALAKAAVAVDNGDVRHTAALALAALGMDAIHRAQATMTGAGPGWRRVKALSQMKFAGFPLPQLPLSLHMRVAAWATGLAIRNERRRILTETMAAGLGAGLGLGFCLLVSVLFVLRDLAPQMRLSYLFRSLYLQPIGVGLGILAVAGAWVILCALRYQGRRRQTAGRIVGFWLGFVLGLVVFWLPLDFYAQAISPLPSGKNLLQTYLVGGSLWGAGIIVGCELAARFRPRPAPWQALLGGGLGGAAGCVLAVLLGITVPLVEPSGSLAIRIAEAILAGFGLGGGLAAGWALGTGLRSERPVRGEVIGPPDAVEGGSHG